MTSAFLRKLAVTATAVVGLVFASTAVHADAATTKAHIKTSKVAPVHVAPNQTAGNTGNDWWW